MGCVTMGFYMTFVVDRKRFFRDYIFDYINKRSKNLNTYMGHSCAVGKTSPIEIVTRSDVRGGLDMLPPVDLEDEFKTIGYILDKIDLVLDDFLVKLFERKSEYSKDFKLVFRPDTICIGDE